MHLYGITSTEKPFWPDECDHGIEHFVCSFTIIDHTHAKVRHFDLYLFPSKFYGQEVCLRYGNNGGDYCSPGSLLNFVNSAGIHWNTMHEYEAASKILRSLGKATWEPRT